jgi:hypothetical protein
MWEVPANQPADQFDQPAASDGRPHNVIADVVPVHSGITRTAMISAERSFMTASWYAISLAFKDGLPSGCSDWRGDYGRVTVQLLERISVSVGLDFLNDLDGSAAARVTNAEVCVDLMPLRIFFVVDDMLFHLASWGFRISSTGQSYTSFFTLSSLSG